MPKPVHNVKSPHESVGSERSYSADVPTYDSYPAEPSGEDRWEPMERAADNEASASGRDSRHETARSIGAVIGSAVHQMAEAHTERGRSHRAVDIRRLTLVAIFSFAAGVALGTFLKRG